MVVSPRLSWFTCSSRTPLRVQTRSFLATRQFHSTRRRSHSTPSFSLRLSSRALVSPSVWTTRMAPRSTRLSHLLHWLHSSAGHRSPIELSSYLHDSMYPMNVLEFFRALKLSHWSYICSCPKEASCLKVVLNTVQETTITWLFRRSGLFWIVRGTSLCLWISCEFLRCWITGLAWIFPMTKGSCFQWYLQVEQSEVYVINQEK